MFNFKISLCLLFWTFYATSNPAYAIPSPELIIGSVSSLGQVLAVVFALVSGGLATLGAKLGMKPRSGKQSRTITGKAVFVLLACVLGLLALNFWQFNNAKTKMQTRLQATLVRPAQFSGTKIQDASLKETSFDAQNRSQMGISTQDANQLLDQSATDPDIIFMDIRETAEREMGGLINSSHQRFPDIQQSLPEFTGKQVVLYCHNGNRSSETCENLRALGIDCRFIAGGLEKWIVEGRPFSDSQVRSLSDLRAIPEYENKDTLLDTDDFKQSLAESDLQIIDTRYPGDFALGHLPNAINIPLRALPTLALEGKISALGNRPTIVACYDRRSCFMGQVLGWELAQKGIPFQGRYTTPWEYFVPPTPKPHVLEWQAEQSVTLWQKATNFLATIITSIAEQSHIIVAIFCVSFVSRILILPIAIKSERDQIVTNAKAEDLKEIKNRLANDPVRRASAIKGFYAENGLTPLRNMSALLFLPVMMLGLSSIELVAKTLTQNLLWIENIGASDPFLILPILFSILAGIYLVFAVAKNKNQRIWYFVLGAPVMAALTFQLSAAGNIYLCFSLVLLLMQRAYVVGTLGEMASVIHSTWRKLVIARWHMGVIPLSDTQALATAGNKALRLSIMRREGLPVPNGVVLSTSVIDRFINGSAAFKSEITEKIWNMVNLNPCAVRSSAAAEDGADQSFAGIFDSTLNVQKSGMEEAINNVAASFKNTRSQEYGVGDSNVHDGNILIQNMVHATFAGVLFTQDPQAPGQVLIEMANGTADDLVSGRVTPLTLRYGRYTNLPMDETSCPIDLQPLLKLGRKIEEVFGTPQDIEWAFGSNGFEIVQSRDITTLHVGSDTELLRRAEWRTILEQSNDGKAKDIVLEQDEMSEVLPRPTPLSFSIMKSIWGAGGSVDLAARGLGLESHQPEQKPGHLVQFFGKLYSDPSAKHEHALIIPTASTKAIIDEIPKVIVKFETEFLPELEQTVGYYSAMDFDALPRKILVEQIAVLQSKFVHEIYVFAETINILAGITLGRALSYCNQNGLDGARVLQGEVMHSPINLLAKNCDQSDNIRMEYLLSEMGHRSAFDYEIADQRYGETPELLWNLAQMHHDAQSSSIPYEIDPHLKDALVLQDLKEHSKHQSLRVFAQLRRAVLAFGKQSQLGVLVFYLEINEIIKALNLSDQDYASIAKKRQETGINLRKLAPNCARISLLEAEQLSSPMSKERNVELGELSGTRVSGDKGITGRCFVVSIEQQETGGALDGFAKGDILVCQMVHPAWLPQVLLAGAVLAQVGGWLSHMAIVARERDVNMFVACTGLDQLRNGAGLEITKEGEFTITNLISVEKKQVLG
jgi:rhodanese-related sulfurtransferase/membrane protein insertase Oxa1/YidC/SpoIIIJ/phosphohistidine swiveling domain-containing protein